EQRLLWLNGAHIRALGLDELFEMSKGFWPKEAAASDDEYKKKVLALVQERVKFFKELPALTLFFFKDLPVDLDLIDTNKQLAKFDKNKLKDLLQQTETSLGQSDFSADDLAKRLNELLGSTEQKPSVLFSLIRIATTQAPASPGLAETMSVVGKEICLRRIDAQLSKL
ncbi:MAG TPA: glutamate--tRNA ligase, partial [Patescibacteria group bacterium]|nr:glutamate--tRNA ligase [Patescibacteria group bacterium]